MKYVLFVCTRNAGRSQMARAFFERYAPAEARVREFVGDRLERVRTDRTAHQLRLERLLGPLVKEFGTERRADEIRAGADAVLDRYDDVPVRSHVLVLAHGQTRDCLQSDVCYELAGAG